MTISYCSEDSLGVFLDRHPERLIYFRRFDMPLDAIAHKQLLQRMSLENCRRIIRRMNPCDYDLRPLLISMLPGRQKSTDLINNENEM